jgi:hypothetical protein
MSANGFGGFGAGKARKKRVRHEAMHQQFAPPHAFNKALRMHQRITGTHQEPPKMAPPRVRRAREFKQRADHSDKGSEG